MGQFEGKLRASLASLAAPERAPWILFGLALVVRAIAASVLGDTTSGANIWEYGLQGHCAIQTGGDLCLYNGRIHYPSAYMPPLLSYFWMGLFAVFGDGARVTFLAANVVVGAGCAPLLFALGRRTGFSNEAAFFAALILSLYPTFLFVSSTYHATNFTVLLVLLFALTLASALRRADWRTALVAGCLAGLCALTRTELLLAGVAGAVLLAWGARRNVQKAGMLAASVLLGLCLIIGPWVLRNEIVFGRFIPVANSEGYNLWKAFGPL